MAEQGFWRFTVQHKKRDDVDEEAFVKWYKEVLMPECARILKRHDIPRFSCVRPQITPSILRLIR